MCINNYIQKGNNIKYISEEERLRLSENKGYFDITSYVAEGLFTRSIMYALKLKSKDIEAIGEYLFGSKEKFVEICKGVLGEQIEVLLTEDLKDVKIYAEDNNSNLYHEFARLKLSNILENYINEDIIIQYVKRTKEQVALYLAPGPKTDDIYRDPKGEWYANEHYSGMDIISDVLLMKKLKYEWLDFSNVNKDNVEEFFKNIKIEDIQEICKKSNGEIARICEEYGYSDFIKSFIKGWYLSNKGNLENFEKIIPLTGGIPVDIFRDIISAEGISNVKDIINLMQKFKVNYLAGWRNLELIMGEIKKINCTSEEFQKIIGMISYIYEVNKPQNYFTDCVNNVINIIKKNSLLFSKGECEVILGCTIDSVIQSKNLELMNNLSEILNSINGLEHYAELINEKNWILCEIEYLVSIGKISSNIKDEIVKSISEKGSDRKKKYGLFNNIIEIIKER